MLPVLLLPLCLAAAPVPEDGAFRGAVEMSALGVSAPHEQSLDAVVFPSLGTQMGSVVRAELGAPLRLTSQGGGVGLRRADWDERSDFGQLVQLLQLGSDETPVSFSAGPAFLKSLGHGHLVSRYWNRTLEDYHPASGALTVAVGAVRAEAFASDVLALRLFGAELSVDLARALVDAPALDDWFHGALSVAHDEGRAAGSSPPLTMVHADVDAALLRTRSFSATLLLGAGARTGGLQGAGGLIGFALEARFSKVQLGASAELRRRTGGFEHEVFDAGYELARVSASGFSGEPLVARERPAENNGKAELRLEVAGGGPPLVSASVSTKGLGTDKVDVDAVVTLTPGGTASALLRGVVMDVGGASRALVYAEARIRFIPSVYGLVNAGTQFGRTAGGGLERAWFAGLGAGVDFSLPQ
jgi:hypothetical protein